MIYYSIFPYFCILLCLTSYSPSPISICRGSKIVKTDNITRVRIVEYNNIILLIQGNILSNLILNNRMLLPHVRKSNTDGEK